MANRSMTLIIRECNQNCNEIPLTPDRIVLIKRQQTISVGKDVEEREPLCTVGRNVNRCSHYRETCGVSSKIKIELPYPAIPLLVFTQRKRKTLIWKDRFIPVFIETLFTTAKIWKQSMCPLIGEWIKKMWYVDTVKNISQPQKWKSCYLWQHGWT